jgi:hypothetical protein
MIKTDSSNIEAFEYADQNLTIKFRSGGTYTYQSVDSDTYEKFVLSESKGKFFHSDIKNKFEYTQQEKV